MKATVIKAYTSLVHCEWYVSILDGWFTVKPEMLGVCLRVLALPFSANLSLQLDICLTNFRTKIIWFYSFLC